MTRFEIRTNALDRLTDGSRALLSQFEPEKVTKTAAVRVRRLFVNHLTLFHQRNPNQFGARRTGIYADMARATSIQEGVESSVSVTHVAILQKIFGGPIRPRQRRYLTLPAIAEAYGRPSRDFPTSSGLRVQTVDLDTADVDYIPEGLRGRETAKALVEQDYTELSKDFFKKSGQKKQLWEKATRKGGRVIYWLVRSVNQKPTEGIVPNQAAIDNEIVTAVDQLFKQTFAVGAQTFEGPLQPRRTTE